MRISLYDGSLNRIAIIQEQYISCLWEEGYNTLGNFCIELQATETLKNLVKPDIYVKRDDRPTIMIIKSVDIENGKIVASGKTASRVLDDVSFIGTINDNSIVTTALKNAYDTSIRYPNVIWKQSAITKRYPNQISNKSILELAEDMCQKTDLGFRAIKEGTKIAIEVYEGTDKGYVFRSSYGNLKDEKVILSSENYKNYAIVLGEDREDGRKRVDVDIRGDGEDRLDLIVDARDLQQEVQVDLETEEDDLSSMSTEETIALSEQMESEYESRLYARGVEKLMEKTKTWQCGFTPLAYDFATQYDLGDIITVILEDMGITLKTRVTKFSEKSQRNATELTINVGEITIIRR